MSWPLAVDERPWCDPLAWNLVLTGPVQLESFIRALKNQGASGDEIKPCVRLLGLVVVDDNIGHRIDLDETGNDERGSRGVSTGSKPAITTSVSEPFVGAEVVAEFLSLSPRTIRGWASRGRIPCFKRNGTVRYRLSEVSAKNRAKASSDGTKG